MQTNDEKVVNDYIFSKLSEKSVDFPCENVFMVDSERCRIELVVSSNASEKETLPLDIYINDADGFTANEVEYTLLGSPTVYDSSIKAPYIEISNTGKNAQNRSLQKVPILKCKIVLPEYSMESVQTEISKTETDENLKIF